MTSWMRLSTSLFIGAKLSPRSAIMVIDLHTEPTSMAELEGSLDAGARESGCWFTQAKHHFFEVSSQATTKNSK